MSGPDYYQLLRIPRTADAAQIRQAYVRQVKHAHPDLANPGWAPTARLQDLQRAYRCLLDPDARAVHDAQIEKIEQAHIERLRRVQRRLRKRPRSSPRYKRADDVAPKRMRSVSWRLVWLVVIGAAIWAKVAGS